MKKTVALVALILAFIQIAANAQDRNSTLVFRNVTLIDMRSEQLQPNMTVVIKGNRIAKIGKNIKVPKDAEVVDAKGKFMIPGLWDMHVHTLFDGRTGIFFPMFVANGVTGVRDMGSPLPLEQTNKIRREIAEGKILGPRISVLTGKILDGVGSPLPIALAATTNDEGQRFVRSFKEQGADFIKVYDLLSRDVYLTIVDEAKRQKIPFAGHIPFSMTAAEVSDLGQKSIEHNVDVFLSSSRNEAELRKELRDSPPALSNQIRNQVEIKAIESYDERKAADLFARFAQNNTWLCPTLATRNASILSDLAELSDDSRMKYIPVSVRANWTNIFKQRIAPIGTLEQRRKRFQSHVELTGKMRRAKVAILAGTDTGWANPSTFAGFTLHDELRLLVKSGFSSFQALQSATVNPAKFLNLEKTLGTIEKGKLADLVLLEANPLADISNTRKINAVVMNGRYLSREFLDKMLADVEATVKKK